MSEIIYKNKENGCMKIFYRFFLISFVIIPAASFSQDTILPLPSWLNEHIEENKNKLHPDIIEEVEYDNKRAFQLTRTDHFDSGDEHVLFNEKGTRICTFGGYIAHVSTGACHPENIRYVSKINTDHE
jgi:hypothetical protein